MQPFINYPLNYSRSNAAVYKLPINFSRSNAVVRSHHQNRPHPIEIELKIIQIKIKS